MPQISIRGISLHAASEMAEEIRETVVSVTGIDAKYVTTEYIESTPLYSGSAASPHPKVDILWLSGRSQEMHDAVAAELTKLFRRRGFDKLQIAFTNMPPAHFYDNGQHY